MRPTSTHPAITLANERGLVRASELARVGASGGTLKQLLNTGVLQRVGRGVYAPGGLQSMDDLGPIAIKSPNLVFCLLTALRLHGLTTQSPHEVWVAVGLKARPPRIEYPPLHVVRMSEPGFDIVQVRVEGAVHIPVTSVAKTVADCFKFRSTVGTDIALEALRDAWHQKMVSMDELWIAAEHCRMANVMRPYMQSLI